MKLHRLELTGFGPFRETQTVDFDAFDDDGLFLISGRTGTGKSSILDGVSFALYGTVPRYDGGERRLRSDHSYLTDPTQVRLEFTVADARWRVTRSPEYDRPAKRGGGLTTEIARAELEERVDGIWVGRAAKPRTVGEALGEILGLNAQQFQQVILLAQNKFSRFLLAPGDERQALLRTLFGTRRFEQYRDDLEQRRRDAQKSLDAGHERARTLLEEAERLIIAGDLAADETVASGVAERREAASRALQRAAYRVENALISREQADAASHSASASHAALVSRAQRTLERAALRTRLDGLDAREAQIAADRSRLDRARAAEVLRGPVAALARATRDEEDARRARANADERWRTAEGDVDVDVAVDDDAAVDLALAERREALTAEIVRVQAAMDDERELIATELTLTEHARETAEVVSALAALDQQRALVAPERERIDEERATAEITAGRRDDVMRQRDQRRLIAAAAHEAHALAPAVDAAERAYAAANLRAGEAVARVTALMQARLSGYAGELAAELVEGEPCAVCGSLAHPHPATPIDDHVTAEMLAESEDARDSATADERAAGERARQARDALTVAQATSGGIDPAAADAALVEGEAEVTAVEAAALAVVRLRARREELEALALAADAEHAQLTAAHAALREAHAVADADATRLRAVVAAARGAHATVAARLAEATAALDLIRTLIAARGVLADKVRAREVLDADLDAQLAASPFDAAHDVDVALLTETERRTLDAAIAAYVADVTATRARLLDLELGDAGESDADVSEDELTASELAATAADARRADAIAAHRDAENAAARLRDLLVQTDQAVARAAEVADDAEVITRLADTVAGRAPNTMKMDLETFVLAAELEEIVAAANLRLAEMSSGRYTLHHSDARAARGRASGLGIDVLDAHTGRLRSPQSLSGGETFLASLALALGLGEVVTSRAGGIRLDTLFVDEGFGSLDPETLELAMRTLDELRAGGRTVGVISHVEAMKEQLPAQIVVESTPEGPSIIRQAGAAG